MRASRMIAAVAVAASATACTTARADPPGPRTIEIRMHHSRFEPSTVDAAEGETIRFVIVNADPIDHEFILGDEAVQDRHERGTEAFHPPRPGEVTVLAGRTVRTVYTFEGEDLLFGCHVPGHYAYGMHGVILVS